MTKAELRSLYLEKRRSLSFVEISTASREIAERFFDDIDLSGVGALSTYIRIAKFGEIDTSAVYYRIWKDRPWMRTFAPRIDITSGGIENVALYPDTPFTENRWGIREPAGGDVIDAGELDLVIIPLLAVDLTGHRVGYGKGAYDRFLRGCKPGCLKVGLNYYPPDPMIGDISDHDIAIDICITPQETYRF